MRWISAFLPVFLWGQTFFANFSSGFISRTGRRDQKPASAFQVHFTGGLNFHGISAGINLYINSEDKFTPQATSFYSLTPTWSWGRVYIGNFSPSFSPLTLSGTNLLGGGVELFPGIFRLFIVSGRIKKASTDSSGLSYERFLWGVRIGLGRLTGTRITLINSKDISSSASDSVMRAHGIYPQENWVVEVSQKVSLFRGRFRISGLGAVTLLTRDITAGSVEIGKIPSWVKKNFRINSSTSVDYAYRVETSLNLRGFSISYIHGYAGPGYQSHGVSGNVSDRKEHQVRTSVSPSNYLHIGGSYCLSRDNIVNTRNGTSSTRNGNVYLSFMVSRHATVYISSSVNQLDKAGETDTLNLENNTVSFNSGINLRLARKVSLNMNGGVAKIRTHTLLKDLNARSTSVSVSLLHRLSRGFSYSVGYSMTDSRTDTLTGKVHSPSVGLKFDLFRRLNLSLSARAGISETKKVWNFGVYGGLKITRNDLISLKMTSSVKEGENSFEFRAFYNRNFRVGR